MLSREGGAERDRGGKEGGGGRGRAGEGERERERVWSHFPVKKCYLGREGSLESFSREKKCYLGWGGRGKREREREIERERDISFSWKKMSPVPREHFTCDTGVSVVRCESAERREPQCQVAH